MKKNYTDILKQILKQIINDKHNITDKFYKNWKKKQR